MIIPVKNEGLWIRKTLDSLLHAKTTLPFEVIVVDNGSEDGCCDFLSSNSHDQIQLAREKERGISKARNTGARLAQGDYLIFCDAHLVFEDNWMDRLIEPLQQGIADAINPCIADVQNPNRMGFGYTWGENLSIQWNAGLPMPFPSPFLAGGCLAIPREVFNHVEGFDDQFRGWGYEDQEMSLKLWLWGYKCWIQPKVKILHFFRTSSPPYPYLSEEIDYNLLRMSYLHFKEERIEKCRELLNSATPKTIEQKVLQSGVLEMRNKYKALRKYDDDWFMDQFGIPF